MLTATFVLLAGFFMTGPFEGPFKDLTVEQALAAAQKENKFVLIDFFTTWCVPCKKLDSTTWKDAAVVAWLNEKAIALKIDAEKEADLAKKHNIRSYPTMLFLKADGTEIDRIVGYKDPTEFLSNAKDALAGKNAVIRAKERLVGHEDDPNSRDDYATELARSGRYEEALKEYLWCFDNGRDSPGYGGVRLSFLLGEIHDLGRSYPPAIQALEQRRESAEALLVGGTGSWEELHDFVALNRELGSNERNLSLFDHMQKAGPLPERVRFGFVQNILPQLAEARRYQDILDLVGNPESFVKDSTGLTKMGRLVNQDMDEEMRKMMESVQQQMRLSAVTNALPVYEALLGLKDMEVSSRIADHLIEFLPKGSTYKGLIESAIRAEAFPVATALVERGRTTLTGKEAKAVERAGKKIPQPK